MRGDEVDEINLLDAATEFTFEPGLEEVADYPGLPTFRRQHVLCVRRVSGSWAIVKWAVPYSWDPKLKDWVLGTFLLGTRTRALRLLPEAMAAYEAELTPMLRREMRMAMEARK